MDPIISVIIPVYNAEEYLGECIESVLNQTFSNIEVILVNDGSTDRCAEICDDYKKSDQRICYINQENGGVCKARNTGLNAAKGKLITFVDSDDWMPEDGLEILYDEYKRTNADLIVADISFVEKESVRHIKIFDKNFTTKDKNWINSYELACIGYGYNPNPGTKKNTTGLGSMGNKLYKREIIEAEKLRFDPYTLGIYEDNLFVLHYLEKASSVSYIDKSVYYYRMVSNSNSRGFKSNTLEINQRIFEKIKEFIDDYKEDSKDLFEKAFSVYVIRRLEASLSTFFFANDRKKSLLSSFKELHNLIRSEPYNFAIKKVDWRKLNPQNHRITWATAKTGSAVIMWLCYHFRLFMRKLIMP